MDQKMVPANILTAVESLLAPYGIKVEKLLAPEKKNERDEKLYLSIHEAEVLYSVSRSTLTRWGKKKLIKMVKCSEAKSGKVLIDVKSLELFLRKHSM